MSGAEEGLEQVQAALDEVDRRLRAPSAENLEEAVALLGSTRERLKAIPAAERAADFPGAELGGTLRRMRQLAEQAAAFYLGLTATLVSIAGAYNRAGEPTAPTGGRSLSVEG